MLTESRHGIGAVKFINGSFNDVTTKPHFLRCFLSIILLHCLKTTFCMYTSAAMVSGDQLVGAKTFVFY